MATSPSSAVQIGPEAMIKLKDQQLTPGMPAEVVIKTRERTLLGYLVIALVRAEEF